MATNHGAFEWIKVPDKNNPGQAIKKWVRDSWSRRKIVALTNSFAVMDFTLSSANGWTAYSPYPDGMTVNHVCCISISAETSSNTWRAGTGIVDAAFKRLICEFSSNGVRVYNDSSNLYGKRIRILVKAV